MTKYLIKSYFPVRTTKKTILKIPRGDIVQGGLTIAEKIRTLTRDVVVRLERVDISQAKQSPQNVNANDNLPQNSEIVDPSKENLSQPPSVNTEKEPNQNEVNKQKSNGNDSSELLRFCEDCAESFDLIFEEKCQAYNAPYNDLLQQEIQINIDLDQQLEEIENRWNEEAKKFYRLSQKVDEAQDKWAALFQENADLRYRVESATAAVSHDHNYAKAQQ